jgi:hypothetical protein
VNIAKFHTKESPTLLSFIREEGEILYEICTQAKSFKQFIVSKRNIVTFERDKARQEREYCV